MTIELVWLLRVRFAAIHQISVTMCAASAADPCHRNMIQAFRCTDPLRSFLGGIESSAGRNTRRGYPTALSETSWPPFVRRRCWCPA